MYANKKFSERQQWSSSSGRTVLSTAGMTRAKFARCLFIGIQNPTDHVPYSSVTPNMTRNTSDLMIQWSPMLDLCWQRDTYSDIGGHLLLLGQHNSMIYLKRQRHRWTPSSIVEMQDLYFWGFTYWALLSVSSLRQSLTDKGRNKIMKQASEQEDIFAKQEASPSPGSLQTWSAFRETWSLLR